MTECCVCSLPSLDGFDHDQCTDPAWCDYEETGMETRTIDTLAPGEVVEGRGLVTKVDDRGLVFTAQVTFEDGTQVVYSDRSVIELAQDEYVETVYGDHHGYER